MSIKRIIVKKSNHEHDIILKEVDDLEEEKEEKYKQLEFDFKDDQVTPI